MISDLLSLAHARARRWTEKTSGHPSTCDVPTTAALGMSGCHPWLSQICLISNSIQFSVFQVQLIHPFPLLWYYQWQLSFLFCLPIPLSLCDSPSRDGKWEGTRKIWNLKKNKSLALEELSARSAISLLHCLDFWIPSVVLNKWPWILGCLVQLLNARTRKGGIRAFEIKKHA